jgi:hypothetical protein
MGDKGKKDKDKSRKQKTNKQERTARRKLEKQPRRTPWRRAWWGVRGTRTVDIVLSLGGSAMADGAAEGGDEIVSKLTSQSSGIAEQPVLHPVPGCTYSEFGGHHTENAVKWVWRHRNFLRGDRVSAGWAN